MALEYQVFSLIGIVHNDILFAMSAKSRDFPVNIALLAYPNFLRSSFYGIQEFFDYANVHLEQELFNITVLKTERQITTESKSSKTIGEDHEQITFDCLIVPPGLGEPRSSSISSATQNWIKQEHQKGTLLTSACAGSFIFAESGILNNSAATTHWKLESNFKSRFPEIKLDCNQLIIKEGNIVTAGGLTSWVDLCIYLTGHFVGSHLAHTMSRFFLVDTGHREQRFYTGFSPSYQHGDESVVIGQKWIEKHFNQPFELNMLSKHLNLSSRTLQRRFKLALNMSPTQYLQRLRIQKAKESLETSNDTVESIIWNVGYEDVPSFGKLFKKTTGLSPAAYRRRFKMKHLATA